MKIAYVTDYDAKDVSQWSGLGYYIADSLTNAGAEINFISNLKDSISPISVFISKFKNLNNFNDRWFQSSRSEKIAKQYAAETMNRIDNTHDCIFSPSSFPLAFLETRKPKVFYTDATFKNLVDYYPGFAGLGADSIKQGHKIEKQALDDCALAIYSSEWAASSAVDFYGINKQKIKVLPFGANIITSITQQELSEIQKNKSHSTINLLFIAVEWNRKGGDIVIETCNNLIEAGYPVKLNIVGIKDIPKKYNYSYITNHSFLNKSKVEDINTLHTLFTEAHFLFAPSLADCTPVVFAEAAAFGLPVIATNTGGIPSIVKHNQTGYVLPVDAGASLFTSSIIDAFKDRNGYTSLSSNAYTEYVDRLNWKTTGKLLYNLVNEVVYN